MVKVERIKAPSGIPAEGSSEGPHARGAGCHLQPLINGPCSKESIRPISQDGALSEGHILMSECLPFAP